MNQLLASLLKTTYLARNLQRQLTHLKTEALKHPALITPDIIAKGRRHLPIKRSKEAKGLITPEITEIKAAQREAERLPVVFITLAIHLTKEEETHLGQWFRREVAPNLLLDIKSEPEILGGCKLIWQGREEDLSLRTKLEKGLKNKL